ncbi:MAG: hypothetical protein ACRERE_39665, partial [Candidatus Entotheonellia bacterium]
MGEVTVSDAIPPGRYRAEIALYDPWGFPHRPRRGAANTADIVVGTPANVIARLNALDGSDPFTVLELAIRRGQIVRWLDAEELSKISAAALVSTLELLAETDHRDRTSDALDTVSILLFRNPDAAFEVIGEAFATGLADRDDLLRVCLVQLPRILKHRLLPAASERVRSVWEACPPLAVLVDGSAALTGDTGARSRCEAFLGWSPGANVALGRAADQALLGKSAEELRAIFRILDLVPRRLLSLDEFVSANFDWLLAFKERRAPVETWWRVNRHLLSELPAVSEEVARHLAARAQPVGSAEWGAFTQTVVACVVHIFTSTDQSWQAAAALREASAFAGRLITRDLCLAGLVSVHVVSTRTTCQPMAMSRNIAVHDDRAAFLSRSVGADPRGG